jgi:hypothetical protein
LEWPLLAHIGRSLRCTIPAAAPQQPADAISQRRRQAMRRELIAAPGQSQGGTDRRGLHRPRLGTIMMSPRLPLLILIAAPFSSRLSRYSELALGWGILIAWFFIRRAIARRLLPELQAIKEARTKSAGTG